LQYVYASAHRKRQDWLDEMEDHQQYQKGVGQKEIENDTIEKHRAIHQGQKGCPIDFQTKLEARS
jgi:hypothetical protein